MADKLIFPEFLLCHFARGFKCEKCHTTGHTITLLYPLLELRGTVVTLTYPVRCPCGAAGHITLEWPLVLFGIALAEVAMIEAHRRYGSKASMTIKLRETPIGRRVADAYERVLNEFRKAEPARRAKALGSKSDPPPRPSHPYAGTSAKGPLCTELLSGERLLFDGKLFKPKEWAAFLKRIGYEIGETPGPPDAGQDK